MFRTVLLAGLVAASPAFSAPPEVVTDIPVTQALVSAVAGETVAPRLLLDRGADPHHATLRPSQARLLSRADLVISVGAGLTPWLDRAVDAIGGAATMTLSEVAGTHRIPLSEGEDDHGHGGGVDPHLWLDPRNATVWIAAIAGELEARDPGNAVLYQDRAEAAIAAVDAAAQQVESRIAALSGRPILVAHDAWAYAAEAFGIEVAGHIADSAAAAPGAAHLAELNDLIRAVHPVCILAAPTDPMAQAERVSRETGLPIVTVDPLGTGADGLAAYIEILTDLAAAMETCAAAAN